MNTITTDMIRRESGQYDPEVVTRLTLCRLRIKDFCAGINFISNLERCSALQELNLSWNEISSIDGLETLVSLRKLDLSHNCIKIIGESVTGLSNLEALDLRANEISNIDDITHLGSLVRLHSFSLRGPDGEDSNPACQHPAYTSIVLRTLRCLNILDCGHVNIIEETDDLLKRLEEIVPNESLCRTPPLEKWLDVNDFDVDSDPDLGALGASGGTFVSTSEAIQTVSDLLSVECKRLLYKADNCISKAIR